MITEIVKEIKSFDYAYEMSDSHSVWVSGTNKKRKIISALKEMNDYQLQSIADHLTREKDKAVIDRYFSEFFK